MSSHVIPIEDRQVAHRVDFDESSGELELHFHFVDERSPGTKAHVALRMDPPEAIELIDQIITQLQRAGVSLRVLDRDAVQA